MLDEIIVDQIIKREIAKEKKKERRDSGWQPVPLYKELELPQYIPSKKENPSGPIEINIWGPEVDDNVIQTNSYTVVRYF